MVRKLRGFGRITGKSYLTPREIKRGWPLPLQKAEKLVTRRRKQGYVVHDEPHDFRPWMFKKVSEIKLKTKVPGEFRRIKVEKKVWEITRHKEM